MKYIQVLSALALAFTVAAAPATADNFDKIKTMMAAAACNHFEFLSVLESEIFNSVDTIPGSAVIASDGRYAIDIGEDQYLYDLEFLYSYSRYHAQVTVEQVAASASLSEEISYITRLDEYYRTFVVESGRRYRLLKTDSTTGQVPDSLNLFLTPDGQKLDRIEFFDENEDFNRILFLSHRMLSECEETAFRTNFPDSVEVIKLY